MNLVKDSRHDTKYCIVLYCTSHLQYVDKHGIRYELTILENQSEEIDEKQGFRTKMREEALVRVTCHTSHIASHITRIIDLSLQSVSEVPGTAQLLLCTRFSTTPQQPLCCHVPWHAAGAQAWWWQEEGETHNISVVAQSRSVVRILHSTILIPATTQAY
jgi:hypothetical protein